jgi:hypothetical protein
VSEWPGVGLWPFFDVQLLTQLFKFSEIFVADHDEEWTSCCSEEFEEEESKTEILRLKEDQPPWYFRMVAMSACPGSCVVRLYAQIRPWFAFEAVDPLTP